MREGGEDDLGEWSGIFACCHRMVKAGEEVMSGKSRQSSRCKGPEVGVCARPKDRKFTKVYVFFRSPLPGGVTERTQAWVRLRKLRVCALNHSAHLF